mgnify:CR=1 FL=1
MESVCQLDQIDHLRLCGAAFEILTLKGYLPPIVNSINYVQLDDAWCQQKVEVILGGSIAPFKARPCKINNESTPQFYVLADFGEHASIFVLFPVEPRKLVRLTARIKQIGALLHPTKPMS